MRTFLIFVCILGAMAMASAQQPAAPNKPGESRQSGSVSADSALKEMFEAKIEAKSEAIKNKDKKTYGELLADDYQGVEVDPG